MLINFLVSWELLGAPDLAECRSPFSKKRLNEDEITDCLRVRFMKDKIYVSFIFFQDFKKIINQNYLKKSMSFVVFLNTKFGY